MIRDNNTNSNNSTSNQSYDQLDFSDFLGDLIDSKATIIGSVVIAALFGLVYGLLATPIFKANALIQVEDNSRGVFALDDLSDIFGEESSVDTELYILKSRLVLGKTVDDLNHTTIVEPNYFPLIGRMISRKNEGSNGLVSPVFGSSYAWGGEKIVVAYFSVPDRFLMKSLTFVSEGEGKYSLWIKEEKLLTGKVGVLSSNFEYGIAINVAELVANPGTKFNFTQKSRLSAIMELKNDFKAASLGKDAGIMDLTLLGEDKEKISSILNSISVNYVSQNVKRLAAEAENSLEFIDQQLPKIKASLADSERALNTYRSDRDSVNLSLETESLLETLVKLESDISTMSLTEADVSRRYTIQHPSYKSFKRQEEDLINHRQKLNAKINSLPETQQKILTLMRDFEVNQAIYLSLQNKSQELAIIKASTVGNARILDAAVVFPKRQSPQKILILIIFSFFGFLVGVFYVMTQSILNRGVSNPKEFENVGFNIYATIPSSDVQLTFDRKKKEAKSPKQLDLTDTEMLLALDNPADLSVEALRSLRTSLHFGVSAAKNNIVMISSGIPEVGKSFITANVGVVLAQSGQRVLVIDADLRRGHLHKRYAQKVSPGLSEYLKGDKSSESLIVKTTIENLDFIPRGSVPPNPSELLMSPLFKDFLDKVSANYDIILIDTPPILAVTDAAIVGSHSGVSLLVAWFDKSTVKELLASADRFNTSGIEIDGLTNNGVEFKTSSYYGGYGYYNYSYKSNENP